jgi:hypothetical protein
MPTLSRPQANVFQCNKRFRVLVAGRRFGKTYLAVSELLRGASWPGFTAWYIAPTYRQAKQIAWKRLKEIARPLIVKPNETDLSVELSTGGTIALRGADNYDSLRGVGLDGVVLDEAADIEPEVWTEVIRPALSDRLGWALFIGTPKGFNHLHQLYVDASTKEDWAAFKYTTLEGGQVPVEEVISARAELDEKTFRQEYEASFENTSEGKVYYAFSREGNVRTVEYDPRLPLIYSMDFNVSPMSSVIAQIHDHSPNSYTSSANFRTFHVLDEICIKDANIPLAVDEFKRRAWAYARNGQTLTVRVMGDAAGNARTHAGPSDYNVVQKCFQGDGRFSITLEVPSSNPGVKDRVNAVNSLLCSADGRHRLFVDPRCKELIKDFEQVIWKVDSSGNTLHDIDKTKPERTHVSDACGYSVEKEFSVTRGSGGWQNQRII